MAEADEGRLEVKSLAAAVGLCLVLASAGLAGQAPGPATPEAPRPAPRQAPGPATRKAAPAVPRPARPPRCGDDARTQARKLLALHMDNDPRLEVAKDAKALPSVRNPADATQRLEVVEVWGSVAKGQYRMRFLYIAGYSPCTLVGQEILEYGSF